MSFTSLLFDSQFWLILGFILVIIDVFLGTYLILPLGVAAFLQAGLFWIDDHWNFAFFYGYQTILVSFSILSVISTLLIRRLFKQGKRQNKDINDY